VVSAVTRGIGLAVVGLIAAVGAQLVQATVNSPLGAAVAVLAGLLAAFTRVDALYISWAARRWPASSLPRSDPLPGREASCARV